jgi:GNAT superfamily N-acetyltransferase
MDYVIRPLEAADEPILWEMVYQGLSSAESGEPPREIVQRPEFARYVQGWGRAGDTGFVAHDKKDGSLLGAVWLRNPSDKNGSAAPELAFVVKPGHRGHGIGTALLTQLVRSNPEVSTISISSVAGKPVLRLYERFGFKTVEERQDAIIMHREA